ncbi:MAG: molybdopterin-dependent oxidoreductase [Deltaproteobacteria bacterium]|nr:molybdopterin-dependent oxidoreductase [Deltaproteobacteria bacterium]
MPRSPVHTACPLDCPDTCDLEVELNDEGRITRVKGGTRSPITDGFICTKVRNIADLVYADNRITHPLVRTGPKGSGSYRRATWEEALLLVSTTIRNTISRSGGEAVFPYHYGGSNGWLSEGALARRFFYRLGASRCDRTLCAAAAGAAAKGLYGKMPGVSLEDYEHANLIVVWGFNPVASGIHLIPIIDRALARGAKLIVVDPRSTSLSRRASLHLRVRPGTDLPVALSILTAFWERDHADLTFLENHTTGAEQLRSTAAEWSVEKAAATAGITPEQIESFLELYTKATPAVIRIGWGVERNRNGGSAIAAIMAIPAVAGKFGVRAGGLTMSNGDASWSINGNAAIAEPEPKTRLLNMSQLSSILQTAKNPGIEVLFVYNANPVATTPNQIGVRAQLQREDIFVVVHEQVMTETAALADVILPATTFLEHRDLRRGYGVNRMYDSAAVIKPIGEARSNNQLFGELLRRLDLERPGDPNTDDEMVDAIFASHPDGKVLKSQLQTEGVAAPPRTRNPVLFKDTFPGTPDQKMHLFPESLDLEAGGLYRYKADPGDADYPLALISPALAKQISSTFGSLRRKTVALHIHADDARERGIADGDEIRIWNTLGEIRTLARVSDETRPGVVVLPKGLWGHHTKNGNTANTVISEGLADLGGQAAFNDARVQVARG